MLRFVDVPTSLVRQPVEQFLVGVRERRASLADRFGQLAAGNPHSRRIAKELANRGERGLADAFHEAHQRRPSGPGQPGLRHVFGQRGVGELPASLAPVGEALMLGDANRHRVDFHLLDHLRLAVGKDDLPAAGRRYGRNRGTCSACRARTGRPPRREAAVGCVVRDRSCPPRLRLLPSLAGGSDGATMSLDGGLEEFEEFLLAAASCCLSWSTWSRSVRFSLTNFAISRSKRALRNFGALFLHLGQSIGREFALSVRCLPRLHGAGHYQHLAGVARPVSMADWMDRLGRIGLCAATQRVCATRRRPTPRWPSSASRNSGRQPLDNPQWM